MTHNRDADLTYLLGAVGSALHAELKSKSFSGLIPRYRPTAPHKWDHPPMFIKDELLGHQLNSIPELMFGHLLDGHGTHDVWARLTSVAGSRASQLRSEVAALLPGLPLDHLRCASMMARVLALLATRGGKLTQITRQVTLTIAGDTYGVSANGILCPGGGRRFKRPHDLDVWAALNMVGSPRDASLRFRDLEAHTIRYAPALAKALRIVIGAAVHSGPEFEEHLLDCFDFVANQVDHDTESVWNRAREVIMGSATNPISQLYDLLRPSVGSVIFNKHFGNPRVGAGRPYTERMRQKHGASVDQLEGMTFVPHTKTDPGELAAAQALLKFQQQIGL